MSRGWCLGSAGFRTAMKNRMQKRGLELEWGRMVGLELEDTRKEVEEAWEERLQRLAKLAKVSLDRLPGKKSDPTKALLAAAMKKQFGEQRMAGAAAANGKTCLGQPVGNHKGPGHVICTEAITI